MVVRFPYANRSGCDGKHLNTGRVPFHPLFPSLFPSTPPFLLLSCSSVQAAGRPSSPSFYLNFNRNFCSFDSPDMFTSGFVTLFLVSLFAAGNVAGYPVPEPIRRALAQRGPAPFEPIRAYVNRDFHNDALMYEKRDDTLIPEGTPVKAPNGVIEQYVKRDGNINTIPEETPTKAPNGVIEEYKRDGNINTIPEETPTKAPNGVIEEYKRDGNINTIPEETPTKAPNGVIEEYKRDGNINTIPEETPTKAPNGVIEEY